MHRNNGIFEIPKETQAENSRQHQGQLIENYVEHIESAIKKAFVASMEFHAKKIHKKHCRSCPNPW